jgi:hypothetical protein
MKYRHLVAIVTLAGSVFVVSTLLAQDRFTLKAPNGIEFSEFRGYEAWQVIAPSQPDDAGGCGLRLYGLCQTVNAAWPPTAQL